MKGNYKNGCIEGFERIGEGRSGQLHFRYRHSTCTIFFHLYKEWNSKRIASNLILITYALCPFFPFSVKSNKISEKNYTHT